MRCGGDHTRRLQTGPSGVRRGRCERPVSFLFKTFPFELGQLAAAGGGEHRSDVALGCKYLKQKGASMRKIVVTEFMTLDGVMQAPEKWSLQYYNDEIGKFKRDELFATGALLLGRVTYETFAAAWPSRSDPEGFADRMNSLPKYVLSSTLQEVAWTNSRLIKGNAVDAISKLKQEPGQDIVVHGSCTLVNWLIKVGLVDEYHLLTYPLVLGEGKRLFAETTRAKTKLVATNVFATGVVALIYQSAATD
jgi:dihydrofolate reductase